MKIDHKKVQQMAKESGTTLAAALRDAGVSRTAYYSLVDKESILPRSVRRLAGTLGVAPSVFLVEISEAQKIQRRLAQAMTIRTEHPEVDFRNVWHTLSLLEERPIERLNRSLRRGRI